MKFSKETLNKLKNFSEINSNLLITKGSTLKTVNTSKSLLGETTITETFTVDDFGIYDLIEFLGILSLFEDPEIEFSDKFVTLSEGKTNIKYFSASKDVLVYPNKDIKFPEVDIEFEMSEEVVATIRKVASVLSATNVCIVGDGENISIKIGDIKNATAPAYNTVLGATDKVFNAIIKVDHFKLMPGNYTVMLSKKKISQFVSGETKYFIAVEADSSFDF